MPFSDQIKDTFLAYNYKFYRKPPDFKLAFIKDIETNLGIFKICISDIFTDMTELPKAYLISRPDALANTILPDLNPDKSICYINSEIHNLFPLNPGGAIATCIELVEKVIDLWASKTSFEHLQPEFSSYWQGQNIVFSTRVKSKGCFCRYQRINIKGENSIEFVFSDDEDQARQWIQTRKGSEELPYCPALTIEIHQCLHIPNDCLWPPKSLKDLFNWLQSIDNIAYQVLLNRLVSHIGANKEILFCFKQESEIFATHIRFSTKAKKLLQRTRGYTTKQKKQQTKGKGRFKQLATALCVKGMVESFIRLSVEDASPSFVFQRNQPNNTTLVDKRIALIGCGTIGAYTAHALTQSGAGGGQGSLTLFDDDILSTGNLGRHLLGQFYLDENKSHALKHYLDKQGLPVLIKVNKKFSENNIQGPWDLIIDTTGDESFSVLLSNWYHKYEFLGKKPTLIHGWIDAYGQAARVLSDNGYGACYCCLNYFRDNTHTPRLPLFSKNNIPDHINAFRRQCGKTYLPFTSQPSLTVAGMVQSMALSIGIHKTPTFRQIKFSSDIQYAKDQILKPTKGCPVCSK